MEDMMSDKQKNDVLKAIRKASDDEDAGIHSLIEMNPGESPKFYLAVMTSKFEGRNYMNLRYIRYNGAHDTASFLKNGINMRWEPGLADAIADALDGVNERTIGYERDEPKWVSIEDDGEE